MPIKQKKNFQCPWDPSNDKPQSIKRIWILKKGRETVSFTRSNKDNNSFIIQKDKERSLSLASFQARATYHQLIQNGYKLKN